MDDNIIPEEETALLFDGKPEDHLQAQQRHLLQLLKSVFTRLNLNNYERKSESLKHLHDWTSIVTVIKRQNMSRKKHAPFFLIQNVLQKGRKDVATGLLVVLHLPTQPWWLYLGIMLIASPLILLGKKDTLLLPSNPGLLHPLHNIKTRKLLLCHSSGQTSQVRAF